MNEQARYDQIEAYLFGTLPEKERTAFEQEVANDPELAAQVAMHRAEHDAMELLIEEDTKAQFQAWAVEAEGDGKGPKIAGNQNGWIITLLAIAVLIIAGIYYWGSPTTESLSEGESVENVEPPGPEETTTPEEEAVPPGEERNNTSQEEQDAAPQRPIAKTEPDTPGEEPGLIAMAESLYDHPSIQLTLRDTDAGDDQEVQAQFDEGDFAAVISALEARPSPDLKAYQMLGHAHLNQNQFKAAEAAFQQIIDGDDPALTDEVVGYYLLAQYAQGKANAPSFQETMQTVLDDPGHPNYELVKAIQNKI
jgi:tetratricopeptide (TPR) repeat protein